jgi:mRNA-degrading endonuclease RelE of RelBE toxin-antitoxin system
VKIQFRSAFLRDIAKLSEKELVKIDAFVDEITQAKQLREIVNIKKLV